MIKSILLSFTVLGILYSCGSDSNKENESHVNTNQSSIENDSSNTAYASKIKLLPIDTVFIKQNFKYKGNVKDCLKWKDQEGTHIVFTSETGVYHTDIDEEEGMYNQNAEVFCHHYIQQKNDFAKKWSIYDFSKDCPMDATARFGQFNLEVTDLNENGAPEIWTIYRIACRGDVSPSTLKLIMYEGDKKYKLQGNSRIELNENEKYGGEITKIVNFDKEKVFNEYAQQKWNKNSKDGY